MIIRQFKNKFFRIDKILNINRYKFIYLFSNRFTTLLTDSDPLKQIKDRIKIVDVDEVGIDTSENWTDKMVYYLEKDNYKNFEDSMRYVSSKAIILNTDEINKILSLVYNKNRKSVDFLTSYINEQNIKLDTFSFHYLILSALKIKDFKFAYDIFVQSCILGIVQNLTVISALLTSISKLEKEEIDNYKIFIFNQCERYFTAEDIE